MKITNHCNLPAPLVRAIENDPYKRNTDYSVTQLLKPPRIVALEAKHEAELEEDASDRIWALMGQLGHLVLERGASGQISEKRFQATRLDKTVSGQVDLLHGAQDELLDYKFTSVWAVKYGLKPEWEQQCNLNALLCRENGIAIDKAQIVAIMRDWSVGEARRDPSFPQKQVRVFDVPLWSPKEQEEFLATRIQMHEDAKTHLPECTPEERWERGIKKFALMRNGFKRAVHLYDDEESAWEAAGPGYSVERRGGVPVRCLDYCAVAKFCEQFQNMPK